MKNRPQPVLMSRISPAQMDNSFVARHCPISSVPMARPDSRNSPPSRTDDGIQLDVHLRQSLLHVLSATSLFFDLGVALPSNISYLIDFIDARNRDLTLPLHGFFSVFAA